MFGFQPWDNLRRPGISPDEAFEELLALFNSSPFEAQHHTNENRRIIVRVNASDRTDHCLYKPRQGRTRESKGTKDPRHFLVERAERIHFVPQVLFRPDEIRLDSTQALLFSSVIRPGEEFIVVVTHPNKNASILKTFYESILPDDRWQTTKKRCRLTYKRKRAG